MTSASSDGETVRAAIAATSLGRLEEAVDGWAALITAGRFASIASIMLLDCARRCGRFEDMALQEPFVESVLGGTEYFKLHREQVETVEQRRLALNVPETLDNLSADELSRIGRAANESQYWRYALQVWTDFLDRAGDPREGMRRIAQCYAALGIHSEAIVYFNEAQRLAPSDQIAQKLDRSKRLESRVRDGFHKHAQRLRDHAAMLALQQAFPQLVARDPAFAASIAAEVGALATAIGAELFTLQAPPHPVPAVVAAPAPEHVSAASVLARLTPLLTPAGSPPDAATPGAVVPIARSYSTPVPQASLGTTAAGQSAVAPKISIGEPKGRAEAEPVLPIASATRSISASVANGFVSGRLGDAVVAKIPLFGATGIRHVLSELEFPAPTEEVEALLRDVDFDAVMFVANAFSPDPRVVKTAQAVTATGRRVLAIGLRDNADPQDYVVTALNDGTPLIRLPNMNRPINIAMRKLGLPTSDRGPRMELWLVAMGLMLGSIVRETQRRQSRIVLHTHDYHGIYVGGLAFLSGARRETTRWFHDVHEFIRQYDIIDPGVQAAGTSWEENFIHDVDHLSTVSEELADRLMTAHNLAQSPTVIYNTNSLASRHLYRGLPAKQKLGLRGKKLLVHSGNVTKGRGVEHIISALPEVRDAVLLLITESKSGYVDDLRTLAAKLGVTDRIAYHPYLPNDEVMGFIADADAGMITADRYGNADVGLANKLFDYVLANVPVVSSDTDAMRRFLTEWPIGEVFEASNPSSLAEAVKKVLAEPKKYKDANVQRMDRVLASSWESQVTRIHQMYSQG
jgi:glycosyltransferase involved in cell wall biosynthesis